MRRSFTGAALFVVLALVIPAAAADKPIDKSKLPTDKKEAAAKMVAAGTLRARVVNVEAAKKALSSGQSWSTVAKKYSTDTATKNSGGLLTGLTKQQADPALASVFTLATSFMGQAAGAWFKHPETPTLIFLGTSLPQLFLTGFSWPREAIPETVRPVGYIFPSGFAID